MKVQSNIKKSQEGKFLAISKRLGCWDKKNDKPNQYKTIQKLVDLFPLEDTDDSKGDHH